MNEKKKQGYSRPFLTLKIDCKIELMEVIRGGNTTYHTSKSNDETYTQFMQGS